jgi:hypothetical protein
LVRGSDYSDRQKYSPFGTLRVDEISITIFYTHNFYLIPRKLQYYQQWKGFKISKIFSGTVFHDGLNGIISRNKRFCHLITLLIHRTYSFLLKQIGNNVYDSEINKQHVFCFFSHSHGVKKSIRNVVYRFFLNVTLLTMDRSKYSTFTQKPMTRRSMSSSLFCLSLFQTRYLKTQTDGAKNKHMKTYYYL